MSFQSSTHRLLRVKSLAYSIYDGFFYSLMVGFAETYFSAYALYLGANHFQMGMLSCLPIFLAGQSQFFTVRLTQLFPSRKKLVLTGVAIQAFALIPLLLTYKFTFLKLEFYIAIVTLYFTANAVVAPVWNSWMGDLVSFARRGFYFGKRNKFVMVGTFLGMVGGGAILFHFNNLNLTFVGFVIIIGLGFLSRLGSVKMLSLKFDIPPKHKVEKAPVSFFRFCRELPKKNYGYLILSMVTVNFGVFLAAAYYTPHLLEHLHLNYWSYTVVISAVLLFKSLASGFWGEIIDKMGAKKIVVVTGFLIGFTTWPWAFSSSILVIFLAQCYTGISWAGYELSTFTFLLDATEPEERTMVTSYFNILNTTAGLAGGLIGASYASVAPDSEFAFRFLFIITSVVRLFSWAIFSPYLQETRVLAPVKTRDVLLRASGFKSTLGLTSRLLILPGKKEKKA